MWSRVTQSLMVLFQTEWGKALYALLLMACVVIFSLLPLFQGKVIYEEDVTNYYLPAFKFYSDALQHGEDPSLAPTIFSGFPLALTQVGGYLDPVNRMLFSIAPFFIAYHARITLNYLLAGFLTYLFARSLRLTFLSSLLAGFAFMTAQYIVPQANILRSNSIYLMPALFLAIHLLWLRADEPWRRSIVPLGIGISAWVISFLGGYTQLNIYSLVAAGAFAAFLFKRRASYAFAIRLAVLGVVSMAMLIPYLRAVLALVQQSAREGGLPWDVASLAVGKWMYAELLTIHLFVPQTGDTTLQSLYIGTIAIFFFFISQAAIRKNQFVLFFWLLFIVSFLSAFPYPLFALWHALPVFNLFRFPPHWFFVTSFAMSVLAGFGVEYVRTHPHARDQLIRMRHLLSRPTGVACLIVILACNFVIPMRYALGHQTVPSYLTEIVPWVVTRMQAEEATSSEPFRTFQPYAGTQLWFFGESRYVFDLMLKSSFNREYVQTHLTPLIWGVDSVSGFDNLEPRRYAKVRAFLERAPIAEIAYAPQGEPIENTRLLLSPHVLMVLGMMNVKYLWSIMPLSEVGNGPDLSFVDARYFQHDILPIHLFSLKTFVPRVHVPTNVYIFTESEDTFDDIIGTQHDYTQDGFVECNECGAEEYATQGSVAITDLVYGNTEITFTANAVSDAWVIIANSNVPGWEATIDGVATPIRYANYIYQGVRVPKGTHTVRLYYRGAYDFFAR